MSTQPPRGVPTSTLRLQLEPAFTLDDAAAIVDHVAALGVSHLYLSPVLQASPGSTHGYDVVDHSRIAVDLGGEPAFVRLSAAARRSGLRLVVDIVPNHMAVPVPESRNVQLWSVLKLGRASRYAAWFDIDWDAQDGRVLLPVLGAPLAQLLAAGELGLERRHGEDVVTYHDHEFPVAVGTAGMPLGELLDHQHYRLASWREAAGLNYRRFFDVTSLIALRVEEPTVFEETHARILELVRRGEVDGLRIDHPDGLADPEDYLARLTRATDGAWVVVEKILEGDEQLPSTWTCAGTTGYDALLRVGGLFVDPDGREPLTALADALLGEHQDLDEVVRVAKELVVGRVLEAELARLLRLTHRVLPTLPEDRVEQALRALLVGMDRYRIYVRPGEPAAVASVGQLADLVRRVTGADPSLDPDVVVQLVDLALDHPVGVDVAARREFCVRFQQTCGPVMAKGIEDTAFYRYVRLVGLNEVGGDPGWVGVPLREFHAFAERLTQLSPATMTTLSTHDTKRSEDVRARLAVLAEWPDAWADWVGRARSLTRPHRPERLDALTEYFIWQTLVGVWPIDTDRLVAYCLKAVREAKLHTSWTDADSGYESAVERFARTVTTQPEIIEHVQAWLRRTGREARANILGQKLVQLTMPGVPDVYQGSDLVDLSLVDPDNRRPVDWAVRRERLARLDAGLGPQDLSDEKLLVTTSVLRLRRECPEAFVGEEGAYTPLESASEHCIAFARGAADDPEVLVLATRLAGRLAASGGWGNATVTLPPGRWRDLLRGSDVDGGPVPLESLLPVSGLPVALLVRASAGGGR